MSSANFTDFDYLQPGKNYRLDVGNLLSIKMAYHYSKKIYDQNFSPNSELEYITCLCFSLSDVNMLNQNKQIQIIASLRNLAFGKRDKTVKEFRFESHSIKS
jgi:hypothetical protein